MAGIGGEKDKGRMGSEACPSELSQRRSSLLIIYKAEVHALNGGLLFVIYTIKLVRFRCIMFPSGGEWGRMGLNGGPFLA